MSEEKDKIHDENVKILLRFAKREIKGYRRELSDDHPYRGIEGVDTIGDLKEALNKVDGEITKIWA